MVQRVRESSRGWRGQAVCRAWSHVLSAVLVLVCSCGARAQRAIPEDAFAYVFIDGSKLGPASDAAAQHAVVDSLLAWCGPGRAVQDATTEKLLGDLIGEALVQGVPISMCVFDMKEEGGDADNVPVALREVRFSAGISIRAGEKADRLKRVIENVLAEPGAGTRVIMDSRISAVEYRQKNWAAWRVVSWTESAGDIDIGIGEGALLRWMSLPQGEAGTTNPMELHRRNVKTSRGASEPVAEVFVNIDQLRRAFADRFDGDAGARLLEVLHLANARSFMLHVRTTKPPVMMFDATWSVRSEPRTAIRRLPISPVAAAAAPDGVTAAIEPDWGAWVGGALDAYSTLLTGRERRTFSRDRRAWSSRRLPLITRLSASLGDVATASMDSAASGCAFGAVVVRLPLKEGVRPDAVLRDFRTLLDPFADRISADANDKAWWLRSKAPAPIRVVTWGVCKTVAGDELVVAIDLGLTSDWSWHAIAKARERMR